jgi:hypothetical protein
VAKLEAQLDGLEAQTAPIGAPLKGLPRRAGSILRQILHLAYKKCIFRGRRLFCEPNLLAHLSELSTVCASTAGPPHCPSLSAPTW